jgi:hypothetical protein
MPLPGRLLSRWAQFSPYRVCILDVRVLAALVATAEQQVERLAGSRVDRGRAGLAYIGFMRQLCGLAGSLDVQQCPVAANVWARS